MATTLIGASPVTFISEDTGKQNAGTQYQIPLPLIGCDTSTTPPTITFNWNPPLNFDQMTDGALAVTLIQNLISLGVLAPHS